MKSAELVKYKQLHLDHAARVPKKWSTEGPYEDLLVFLEGGDLRNQNSQITIKQMLTAPEEDDILIFFQGKNYHVTHVVYPKNQQFARFSVIPADG